MSQDTDNVDETNDDKDPDALTSWANEPSIEDLKQDYQDSISDRQGHISKVDTWLENLAGTPKHKKVKGRSNIQPKLIRKQAEWRYAALSEPFLSNPDIFEVKPVTFEDKSAAEQNELILNYQFNNKIDKIRFVDEYVRTATDEGTVVIKVGWVSIEEEKEVEEPIMQTVPLQDPAQAQKMSAAGLPPVMEIQTGVRKVTKTVLVKNHPTLEVCDYRNLLIDPTCGGVLEDAEFIIYEFEASMSDLKKDGRYKNLDDVNVESASPLAQPDYSNSESGESTGTDFNFKDKPRTKMIVAEYWGFWDINDDGEVEPFLASWIGDTLVRMEKSPMPDGELPFVSEQYLPKRGTVYGEPDGALLEDNQAVIGAVTRGVIDMMGRSANGQQGARKDALDVANTRKFKAGEDYEFNTGVQAKDVFFMHTYPEIPRSAMEVIQMNNLEAESLTGVKSFSSGISGQALGSTATAARGALDAASKRELAILRRLANGIIKAGRKIIALNSEMLDEEEVVRITNEEFVPIRRDDLAGEFDLKLSISTAEADNQKAEELAFMLQTTGPSSDPGEVRMIRAEIAKLRNMPALAKKIEEYQPQPDPAQQKITELNIALLEAQVRNEDAKAKENTVDIDLKSAKAETERAKSRNLNSNSDGQDLDFVEKSTGADKQHDMNLKDQDRKKELDLKGADAMLNEQGNNSSTN